MEQYKSKYLNDFMYATFVGDKARVKNAITEGLKHDPKFTFDNPMIWACVGSVRSIEILELIIDAGFKIDTLKMIFTKKNNNYFLSWLQEWEIKKEKELLNQNIVNAKTPTPSENVRKV